MCACVTAYAQDTDQLVVFDGNGMPYDVNVQKKIEVPFAFKILYQNTTTDGKEVTLSGTIEINSQYRIIELAIDYYLFNGKKETVRATSLNLVKSCPSPATYDFEYSYPLDLSNYEYEIFDLTIIAEEVDTQHI
jgi:hypothetical protein